MSNWLECDVLCIGAGGAGLVAAVTAADAGASVIVLSKGPFGCGNTRIAGGLVLRPHITPGDSTDALMRDILVGGEFLNDQGLVRDYCDRAHLATELMERFGVVLLRKPTGEIAPIPVAFGGHSVPRTLAGYSEGIPIGTALRATAARAGVNVLDETIALRLLERDGAVHGAISLNWLSGEILGIGARQTILATGGLGWIYYPHTSNMRTMTGDGYALALDVGAELVDMEQQQFIPFALTHPESMVGIICGEPAMAGPYGKLIDRNGAEVIRNVRSRTRAEVAAAMAVAREHGKSTGHGGLMLDLTPNFRRVLGEKMFAFLGKTFPAMIDAVRRAYGQEAAKGMVPWDVFPTAHYQMGGVRVDTRLNVRGVRNLFAVGEVMGGLHGANRIGSTALAELFIFGSKAGNMAAEAATTSGKVERGAELQEVLSDIRDLVEGHGKNQAIDLARKLQLTMWENVGPVRDTARLRKAISLLSDIGEQLLSVAVHPHTDCNTQLLDALEVRRMHSVAEAVAKSALVREESRGGHYRLDYPNRDDTRWLKNVIIRKDDGGICARTEDADLSSFGPDIKGGPNALRERIQFFILGILPQRAQEKILNARLNLGEED